MLQLRKERRGAERSTDVNHFAVLLLSNEELLKVRYEPTRSEAISSAPGIGRKVTAVLRGINFRATLGAVEAPRLPALVDYPYRS